MSGRYWCVPILILLLALGGCNRDPESAKRKFLENGNKYFKAGKYKEASIMYRNALKRDMRFGEAYYRLALTDMKLGRVADSVSSLRRAVELQPDNMEAHTMLADIYLAAYSSDPKRNAGFLNELQDLLARLEKKNPNSYEFLRLSGYLNMAKRDLPKTLEFFEKANKVKPNQPDLTTAYAQALYANKQTKEAEALLTTSIDANKTYPPSYDLLYMQYRAEKRDAEALALIEKRIQNNPKDLSARLALAAHHLSFGSRDKMRATLDQVLANVKDFPTAYQDVGRFYLRVNEPDTAIAVYRKGIEAKDPASDNLKKMVVETMSLSGRVKDALAEAEKLVKENPQDSQLSAMRAALWLATGDKSKTNDAINDMQAAVRKDTSNFVLRHNLGRALMSRGEIEPARVQFEEALKLRNDYIPAKIGIGQVQLAKAEFPAAIETMNEVLKAFPGATQAQLIRTAALIGAKEKDQARKELTEIVKRMPEARDALYQLAMLDFDDKRFKEAEEGFRKIAYMTPPDVRGLMGLTEVYMAQRNFDASIKLVQEQIAKYPESLDYHVALGNIAVRAERYDLAIQEFNYALSKQPNGTNYVRLGEAQRRKGALNEALASFRKAKDLEPKNTQAYVSMAMLMESMGQKAEVSPIYEQILQLEPDNPLALNNLAFALADSGKDLDRALTLAQRARQKLPEDPNIADTLAYVYIKKNLPGNALQVLDGLIAKFPSIPGFQYHFAVAHFQQGDKVKAKKALDAAMRGNPKPTKQEEGQIKELLGRIG